MMQAQGTVAFQIALLELNLEGIHSEASTRNHQLIMRD